jgi:hypothetical protein
MPDMRRCELITLIGGACGGTRRAFFFVSLAMGAEELKQQSIVGFDPCLRKAMTKRFTSTVTVQARDRPSKWSERVLVSQPGKKQHLAAVSAAPKP